MTRYSQAIQARMVSKLVGPHRVSALELSRETGISQVTLSRWLRKAARMDPMARKAKSHSTKPYASIGVSSPTSPVKRSGEERLALVAQAVGLEGEQLGEFLRARGVHLEELLQWRALAAAALQGAGKAQPPSKEIRTLKSELARKEKALAEAAALLVLKKKVDQLWGDEDGDTE